MSHQRLKQSLAEYLEGDLTQHARSELDRHLTECGECAAELRALRRTVEVLRGLPAPAVPPDLADAVIERLRAGEGEAGLGSRLAGFFASLTPSGWAAPLAAAAVGLGVTGLILGVDVSAFFGPGGSPTAGPLVVAEQAESFFVRPPTAPVQVPDLRLASERRGAPAPTRSPAVARPKLPAAAAFSGAGALPGLPPIESCIRAGRPEKACVHWQAWMVDLGLRDPSAFMHEVEALSASDQRRWLGQLEAFALRSGAAPRLAQQLRGTGHPQAASLALHLERRASFQR